MYCSRCGGSLADEDIFCAQCGKKFAKTIDDNNRSSDPVFEENTPSCEAPAIKSESGSISSQQKEKAAENEDAGRSFNEVIPSMTPPQGDIPEQTGEQADEVNTPIQASRVNKNKISPVRIWIAVIGVALPFITLLLIASDIFADRSSTAAPHSTASIRATIAPTIEPKPEYEVLPAMVEQYAMDEDMIDSVISYASVAKEAYGRYKKDRTAGAGFQFMVDISKDVELFVGEFKEYWQEDANGCKHAWGTPCSSFHALISGFVVAKKLLNENPVNGEAVLALVEVYAINSDYLFEEFIGERILGTAPLPEQDNSANSQTPTANEQGSMTLPSTETPYQYQGDNSDLTSYMDKIYDGRYFVDKVTGYVAYITNISDGTGSVFVNGKEVLQFEVFSFVYNDAKAYFNYTPPDKEKEGSIIYFYERDVLALTGIYEGKNFTGFYDYAPNEPPLSQDNVWGDYSSAWLEDDYY